MRGFCRIGLLSAVVGLGALLGICVAGSQAHAQFICGVSPTGGEPQVAQGATATSGFACGPLSNANGTGSFNTAIGPFLANASGDGSSNVAVGDTSNASGNLSQNVASGHISNASGNASQNVATGFAAAAFGDGSSNVATGNFANATGNGSNNVAIGNTANASGAGTNNVAIGNGTTATGVNSTAIGNGATATFANSAAFGNGATATRANQQVFGTASNTYTMAGITSGASRAAQSGPLQLVTSDASGNLATSTLAGLGLASTTDITNINNQIAGINNQIAGINAQIGNLATGINRAYSGSAMAMALTGGWLPDSKNFAVSVNWGNFRGQNATAFSGYYRVSPNVVVSGGLSWGVEQGQIGGRAGMLFAW
jgi:hypothetical protein